MKKEDESYESVNLPNTPKPGWPNSGGENEKYIKYHEARLAKFRKMNRMKVQTYQIPRSPAGSFIICLEPIN